MRMLLSSTLAVSGHKLPDIISDIGEKNILCIPSAAYEEKGYEEWLPSEQRDVKKFCKSYTEFDLKNKSETQLRDAIKGMDIIYCTGGNTFCLLEYMRAANFKAVLTDFFEADGIYIGSSAGSIVMGRDIGFAAAVDDASLANLDNYTGLCFVDFHFMPHSDQPRFLEPVKAALRKLETAGQKVVYLKDEEMVWIENSTIKTYSNNNSTS